MRLEGKEGGTGGEVLAQGRGATGEAVTRAGPCGPLLPQRLGQGESELGRRRGSVPPPEAVTIGQELLTSPPGPVLFHPHGPREAGTQTHFTGTETKAQRGENMNPRSQRQDR